jgi:hypothetical protein
MHLYQARIKREQIAANKTTDGVVDDDEDEDETLTREGRRMKRALQKQGLGYGSDDEDSQNPYASEVCCRCCVCNPYSSTCCRKKTRTTMVSCSDPRSPRHLLSSPPHHLLVQVLRDRGPIHLNRIPVPKPPTVRIHQP